MGFNPSNDSDSRNPVRPSWNPAFHGPVILGGPNRYFDPNAFALPPAGTYGNVGRDTLRGPGTRTVDISLLKNTQLAERYRLQFRAEFFNVLQPRELRHAQSRDLCISLLRRIACRGCDHRDLHHLCQIQFGLKLLW